MKLLIPLGLLVAVIVFWAMWGREWLKQKPWAAGFFAWIEPIELALWKKSETILIGRSLWLGSGLVTAYDLLATFATGLDLTPVTTRLLKDVPEDMRGLVVSAGLGLIGLLIGWLRKRTTKPIELVAVPDDAPPAVAAKIIRVEAANVAAVAEVAEAKAEGKV